jgi:glutamyl-tRNA reductase
MMHLLVIGVNHTTAPIAVREQFALTEQQLSEALRKLKQTKSILECVIVNTCNRMEIYAVVDKLERGRDYVSWFIQNYFQIAEDALKRYSYLHIDDDLVSHLFRVTCGLDSLVIGETQILGQIRDHFFVAQTHGTTGVIFNTLFKEAITIAKRAHAETGIADHPVSVGYAAVELARQMFGQFNDKQIVMIGAGKMADLTIKHLITHGAKKFAIVNRTYDNAKQLASSCDGQAYTFADLPDLLMRADIIVSSTGANEFILKKSDIDVAMKMRKHRMLFMIDIALPRDLEPAINEIHNVFLYDLDDLHGIVHYNLEQRQKAVAKVQNLINEGRDNFAQWLKILGVGPLIKALHNKAEAIHRETIASLRNKLPELTEHELRIIQKLSKSMLNQLMREPILKLKEWSVDADRDDTHEMFSELFGLHDESSATHATTPTAEKDDGSQRQLSNLSQALEFIVGSTVTKAKE